MFISSITSKFYSFNIYIIIDILIYIDISIYIVKFLVSLLTQQSTSQHGGFFAVASELLPLLHPSIAGLDLLRREYSEPPRGLEPHSHPLTEGSKGCGACQAALL